MTNHAADEHQVHYVSSFEELISTPFHGITNAICWKRNLEGDFSELINKISFNGNIVAIDEEELCELELSKQGKLAQEVILNDLMLLKDYGAAPVLNLIKHYDSDDNPFFSTDVYSFHVDRSPIPVDTFLCTYYGDSSELVSNSQARQKILIPEIRSELRKQFQGQEEDFETFLSANYFDLHYSAKPSATIINFGIGNLWRLAVDHPESKVPPCIHRAPQEKSGLTRLLLIC